MSYEDYRSGRPPTSTRPSHSAYDSIVSRNDDNYSRPPRYRDTSPVHYDPSSNKNRDPPQLNRQSSAGSNSNPTTSLSSSVRDTFASVTPSTNGKVDNPYMTEAYASTRASSRSHSDISGGVSGGIGGEYYVSSKQKGNMQGKLKDTLKSTMAAAKQDNWKVVCVKATSHDVTAPKGKHVRVIMEGLRWGGSISNRESPAGGIFYHLRKRMGSTEWIVVLKSQTIFHHIFRDGNEKFVEYIAANARNMFKMDFFGDGSTEGISHMAFIKTYGTYIEQWLTMKAAVRFPPGKSRDGDVTITRRYRESTIEELLAALPVVMDTIDCLFVMDFTGPTRHTPPAKPAISMMLRDLTLFWVTLAEGMIRLLDLFFNLDPENAKIALDVYKRFVALVTKSEPFFEQGRSMHGSWQVPQLNGISLDLMESMQQYIEHGPEQREPDFSDEEQYDAEPEPEAEPVPEEYYEPELEYYSEEEPEPLPPPPPRSLTPPESSSSEEESSEEESSSEEEEELPSAPEPAPAPKAFDPLADLLGIESGVGNLNVQAQNPQPTMALQVYGAGNIQPGMFQPASVEHTAQDRVNNVKGIMAATAGSGNAQNGFGVNGTNMQVAIHGGPQAHQQHLQAQQQQMQAQQQMYNSMAMQRQQQMAAYQTMAAYQSMAAQNQQMVLYQQMQQQSVANGMNGVQGMQGMQGMQRMGMMANYTPTPQGNQSVPVMQAENHTPQAGSYRVQKGTKPSRVNADDKAFGPLLDQMKKTGISK